MPSALLIDAAVLVAGLLSIRDTPVGHTGRAPYCMMGICFDGLAEIDGVPNTRSAPWPAHSPG